jgi:hypothetical protein
MKRLIGKIAVFGAVISFILWAMLIFTGGVFSSSGFGFSGFAMFVFFSFFACIITAVFCLTGDLIKFIGKMFANGFNDGKKPTFGNASAQFCTKCGKPIHASAAFCPNCGEKLR